MTILLRRQPATVAAGPLMPSEQMIAAFRNRGLRLWTDGQRLHVGPKELLTDKDAEIIREWREAIIWALICEGR